MAVKTGSKKAGRNKDKCARYRAAKRREHNKLRRIAKGNPVAAAEYAVKHGIKFVAKKE
jgi:hypothetical protein